MFLIFVDGAITHQYRMRSDQYNGLPGMTVVNRYITPSACRTADSC